jgi:hypothetical protein
MPLDALGQGYTAVSSIDPLTGLPIGAPTPQAYTLLKAATANTGTTTTAANPFQSAVRGGDYIWSVEGTFGGATVTLQRLGLDGTTWVNVRNQANTADLTLTAAGAVGVGIGQGASVRAQITAATGTTSLNSSLAGLS